MTGTIEFALRRLAHVLRAENDALAAGDAAMAASLLPAKVAAVQALRAMTPGAMPDAAAATELRALAAENAMRLTLALEVQGRILQIVARAARRHGPAGRYGATGARAATVDPMALKVGV